MPVYIIRAQRKLFYNLPEIFFFMSIDFSSSVVSILPKTYFPVQGLKFKFEFGNTCATRCKFLVVLPKF